MNDEETIGARVRDTRHAQELTREQLAARAGVTHSTVYRIERGTNRPNLDTLFKLAGALGVDPKWLLSGDQEGGKH